MRRWWEVWEACAVATRPIKVFLEIITFPWRNPPTPMETNCHSAPTWLATDIASHGSGQKSLHHYAALLHDSLGRRHMFSHWTVSSRHKNIDLEQRRPAHAKPDFNWLSGPRNGTWKRRCGISCLRSLAPMRRLWCSTTPATFTNPSLLRATPLLRAMV